MRCLGQVRLRSISVLSTEMYKICHAIRIVYFCLPSWCCFRGDEAGRQCGGVGPCSCVARQCRELHIHPALWQR